MVVVVMHGGESVEVKLRGGTWCSNGVVWMGGRGLL